MLAVMNFLRRGKVDPRQAAEAMAEYNVAPELRQRLGDYLATAEDRALLRFNPAPLAAELGLPRRKGLELMGAAVLAGLIELNWEIQCPMCKGQERAFTSLAQTPTDHTCHGCNFHFETHLDDEIQVTFNVHERIRSLGAHADDAGWREQINADHGPVSSHELLTVQIFRDMFVNEPLPEADSFKVKWMALMFTDLGGSTGLYARKGDPRAYSLVRDHFAIIFGAVANAGGAVVKTIGDAVMAVFPSGALAVRAALDSQAAIASFNRERGLADDEQLLLKVGVHAGPTLAVTLNERLDYFGTNVNAAARVQALAHSGETVLTRQVLDDAGVRDLVPAPPPGESLILRGRDDLPFEIYRLGA